jgi:hypothetical protein
LLNFFYTDRILGQAGRKIGESVGSISRGPTPGIHDVNVRKKMGGRCAQTGYPLKLRTITNKSRPAGSFSSS